MKYYQIIGTETVFPFSEIGEHFPNSTMPKELSQEDLDHLEIEEVPDPTPPVEPPPPQPPIITPVSPRQIRQALTRAGLRQGVESTVAGGDQDLKDWWEFSTSFERQNPLVIAMGELLGVSSQQLDDLWQLATSL